MKDVTAWTDDYADVLKVIMLEEVQWLRGLFNSSSKPEE
jgi:hypothetical protein